MAMLRHDDHEQLRKSLDRELCNPTSRLAAPHSTTLLDVVSPVTVQFQKVHLAIRPATHRITGNEPAPGIVLQRLPG